MADLPANIGDQEFIQMSEMLNPNQLSSKAGKKLARQL